MAARRRGITLEHGGIAPRTSALLPQMWHKTLFDELKASAYKCERIERFVDGLQTMPKCVSGRGFALNPASELKTLPRLLVTWGGDTPRLILLRGPEWLIWPCQRSVVRILLFITLSFVAIDFRNLAANKPNQDVSLTLDASESESMLEIRRDNL